MIIILVQFELLSENSQNNDCIAAAIKTGAQNEAKFLSGSAKNIAKLAHDPGTSRESNHVTRYTK